MVDLHVTGLTAIPIPIRIMISITTWVPCSIISSSLCWDNSVKGLRNQKIQQAENKLKQRELMLNQKQEEVQRKRTEAEAIKEDVYKRQALPHPMYLSI